MRKVLFVVLAIAAIFMTVDAGSVRASESEQLYKVGTTWDDAWQRGVAGGPVHPEFAGTFTTSLQYQSTKDCSLYPPGTDPNSVQCGEAFVFSAAYRFENIQLDPHAIVSDACMRLFLSNSFPATAASGFRSHVAVQDVGDAPDFKYVPDVVNRARYGDILWNSTVGDSSGLDSNGAYAMSPDITPFVQHLVNRADWHRGNAIVVIVYGVIYISQADIDAYSHAYGWDAEGYDAHAGHPALLDIAT